MKSEIMQRRYSLICIHTGDFVICYFSGSLTPWPKSYSLINAIYIFIVWWLMCVCLFICTIFIIIRITINNIIISHINVINNDNNTIFFILMLLLFKINLFSFSQIGLFHINTVAKVYYNRKRCVRQKYTYLYSIFVRVFCLAIMHPNCYGTVMDTYYIYIHDTFFIYIQTPT